MNVKDVLALGDMGYTKEEISDMMQDEEKKGVEVREELEKEVERLGNEIKKIMENKKVESVRETVTNENPNMTTESEVDHILKGMLGGGTNEQGREREQAS